MTQTAVDWLIEELTPSISLQQKHIDDLKEKAKEMEKEQQIELLKWRETRFTKEAPLEYVLSEFEKL